MIADTFFTEAEYAYRVKSLGRYKIVQDSQIDELFTFFCHHFKVSPMDVITLSREPVHVRFRDLFTGFARTFYNDDGTHKYTLKVIGQLLNGRDHSTIITSEGRHNDYMLTDKKYQQEFNWLLRAWGNR